MKKLIAALLVGATMATAAVAEDQNDFPIDERLRQYVMLEYGQYNAVCDIQLNTLIVNREEWFASIDDGIPLFAEVVKMAVEQGHLLDNVAHKASVLYDIPPSELRRVHHDFIRDGITGWEDYYAKIVADVGVMDVYDMAVKNCKRDK